MQLWSKSWIGVEKFKVAWGPGRPSARSETLYVRTHIPIYVHERIGCMFYVWRGLGCKPQVT